MSQSDRNTEQLAVISAPGFGLRDTTRPRPCLWFTVKMLGREAQVSFTDREEIDRIVIEAGAYDIAGLDGRACVVRVEGGIVRFVRFHDR